MVDNLLAGRGSLLGWRGLLRLFVVVRRWVLGFGFLVGVLWVGGAGAEEGEVLDADVLHAVIREVYPGGDAEGGVRYPDKWEFFLPFEKKAYIPDYEIWEPGINTHWPLGREFELITPSARDEWNHFFGRLDESME